jgi:hypothetical protein
MALFAASRLHYPLPAPPAWLWREMAAAQGHVGPPRDNTPGIGELTRPRCARNSVGAAL